MGLNRLGIPLIQFGVGCRWAGMIRTGLKHCTGCGECFRQNRDPQIAGDLVKLAYEAIEFKITIVVNNTYRIFFIVVILD